MASKVIQTFLVCVFAIANVSMGVRGQGRSESARDLIRYLTYQTDERPEKERVLLGITSACANWSEDRTAARKLVALGQLASPEIERVFTSLTADGFGSTFSINSSWLLLAYAKINGPAAMRFLRRLHESPKSWILDRQIDQAIAVSLGLSSYVSASRTVGRVFLCRGELPQDALDRLILGVFQSDRSSVASAFGVPIADSSDLAGERKPDGSADVLRSKGGLGYRFQVEAEWARSPESLQRDEVYGVASPEIDGVRVITEFVSGDGRMCSSYPITFHKQSGVPNRFTIDTQDLSGVLDAIRGCVSTLGATPAHY